MYYFFLYSKETRTFIHKLNMFDEGKSIMKWNSADTKSNVRVLDGEMNLYRNPFMIMVVTLCNRSHFYMLNIWSISSTTNGVCAHGSVNTRSYRSMLHEFCILWHYLWHLFRSLVALTQFKVSLVKTIKLSDNSIQVSKNVSVISTAYWWNSIYMKRRYSFEYIILHFHLYTTLDIR